MKNSVLKKSASIIIVITLIVSLLPLTALAETVSTTTSYENITKNSTVYLGEVVLDGETVVKYVYSRDFTMSDESVSNLKTALAAMTDTVYSELFNAYAAKYDSTSPEASGGIKACSDAEAADDMDESWESAVSVGNLYYPDAALTAELSVNAYDHDDGFRGLVDGINEQRTANINNPAQSEKTIVSIIDMHETNSVYYVGEVKHVDSIVIYSSEATTVTYVRAEFRNGAAGAKAYDLWVGGVRATEEALSGEGWSYDPQTCTLTLDNATISGTYEYQPWYEAMIYSAISDLTIVVNGVCVLKSDNPYADGIDAAGGCNITVKGGGMLTIDHAYYGFYIGSWDVPGGDLTIEQAAVTVTEPDAAGIWVNHDINFNSCRAVVTKTNESYNGIVSNIDGTVTVNNSTISVKTKNSAMHFGNTDDSFHKLVIESGYVSLESEDAYGIYVQPVDGTENVNGAIQINGGTLVVNSASGATNVYLEAVTIADGLEITEGNDMHDAGTVIVSTPAPAFIPGDINGDGSVDNKDVVTLFRYVSGVSVEVNTAALDCNGDGSVDNKDVVTIFRSVSGGGVTLSDKPYVKEA